MQIQKKSNIYVLRGSHDVDTIIGGELLNDDAQGGGVKNL